ncbi:ROK family transcriptional regulator [uncultured Cohaesibacter sp.]|uniref:ROK family transcriptional regulator n=1 Tax=uncultured Cohaesibacter sp. TaxID=1002546 RepID=UPI0029C7E0D7|nr:ROK family transcriptional regulator [uncultured Cohaesibacter sp.]
MDKQETTGRARARIIAALEKQGPQSRAKLARETGFSRSTASMIIQQLVSEGIVETVEEAATPATRGAGRPGTLIVLKQSFKYLIAIDFGRLSLKVGIFDMRYKLLDVESSDFSVDIPADEAFVFAAAQVEMLLARLSINKSEVEAVGIGVPGPVESATGHIHAGSILATWTGTDVPGKMSRLLDLPVYMDNDANLGILAESTMGGATNAQVALYVLLSVGVGLGIAINGKVFRGSGGIAGELGHVVTDEHGPLCRCGSRGCLEAQISVLALAQSLSGTHKDISPSEMLEKAQAGDPVARRVVMDAGAMAGRQVGALCNYFNPEVVLVGGELMRAGDMLITAITDAMARTSLARAIESVVVRPGALGERAELYGAALFAHEKAIEAMASSNARQASQEIGSQ